MIRIAVCDDDKQIIQTLKKYLNDKAEQLHNETLDISLYLSAVDFLCDTDKGLVFHIVIMDIEMAGISGVEAGKILRSNPNGDETIIIYISNHDSFYREMVDVGSFRFIKKPLNTAKLDDVFNRALNMALKYRDSLTSPRMFAYKVGTTLNYIKVDDIVYFEKALREIKIYIWDRPKKNIVYEDKFYSKFEEMIEKLPQEQFVQCSRSCVVNLSCVARMEKGDILLSDKSRTRISIGKIYKVEVQKIHAKYLEDIT
ncbi:MAG: LytTR family DNA-binding domain-containing protein [Oscillospiraceae bacterium]|nr:LytTR family DNA-binding domain-containing protein [Oscillospiraceae bacterium]